LARLLTKAFMQRMPKGGGRKCCMVSPKVSENRARTLLLMLILHARRTSFELDEACTTAARMSRAICALRRGWRILFGSQIGRKVSSSFAVNVFGEIEQMHFEPRRRSPRNRRSHP
jgi:hypothetical protein